MPGKDVTRGTSGLLSRKRYVQDRPIRLEFGVPSKIELRAVARSSPSFLIVRAG